MASNRGIAYMGPGKVEVQSIDFPKLILGNRKCEHGVILKIVSTNICGSDQHMVRGRTTAPPGLILGHEITGEVIEAGRDVEFIKVGDLVSVPFNIACGRCRNCKERATGICLNVNPARPGAAYGYVDMGGWVGGQAEYVMVPYADFNLLKFPDKAQAMEKIRDLTCLSDILPTGYHGAVSAGVTTGSTVYVAGGGPVGLACAAACQLLGAACVIVGDLIPERRLIVTIPCRNTREGKTGKATNSVLPADLRAKNSELDISATSNSRLPAMRSKISRAPAEPSIGMKFKVIPSALTSPR